MKLLHRLPPVPETIDLLTNAEVAHLIDRDPSYWIPTTGEQYQKRCLTCGGRGLFRWYDENNEPVDYECDCLGQHRLWSAMELINIGRVYQRLRWADLTETDPEAIEEVRVWFGNLDYHLTQGIGIYLWGGPGSGKSSLAFLAIKELMRRGVNCFTLDFRGLIDLYAASFRNEEDKEWLTRRVRNSTVLLIDNMGREIATTLSTNETQMLSSEKLRNWFDPLFVELLMGRMQSGRPTIITSAREPEWMVQRFGSDMESIFTSMMVVNPRGGNFFHRGQAERGATEHRLILTRPITLGGEW